MENLQVSNQEQGSQLWKHLWNQRTIPKHIHFAWRILHNGIASRINLINKGMHLSPLCPRCNSGCEDIYHIFGTCSWAKQAWFASPLGINFEQQHVEFVDWLEQTILIAPSDTISLVLSLCFEIWNARNKLYFEGKFIQPTEAANKACKNVIEYSTMLSTQPMQNLADHVVPQSSARWFPSPRLVYKINVDDAGYSDGVWGIGAVVHDDMGVLFAATWKIFTLPDVDLAESLGIKLTLSFALDLGFYNLYEEIDSLTVVQAILSSSTMNTHFEMVIDDCKSISSCFHNFKVFHVRREANQVAHRLAKFALSVGDSIWIEDTSLYIVDVLASDL